MRWVRWRDRAPSRTDADNTSFVLTRRTDHGGGVFFECHQYNRPMKHDLDVYWLEGARVPPSEVPPVPSQSISHVRRVEL